jgi:hypothetical protein
MENVLDLFANFRRYDDGRGVIIKHINGKIKYLDVCHVHTGNITTAGML